MWFYKYSYLSFAFCFLLDLKKEQKPQAILYSNNKGQLGHNTISVIKTLVGDIKESSTLLATFNIYCT